MPGDTIDEHFKGKEISSTDSLKGKIDDTHYGIFCIKEPDYVMK